jgi:hypothetical protein
VDTSPAGVPTAQALVARPESKAPNDNPGDDDPGPLNFVVTESETVCRSSSRLQTYWPDSGNQTFRFGILDGPVFTPPNTGPAFFVLGHEDVEGVL